MSQLQILGLIGPKTFSTSPLSENREHCRHLSHFPPQIWKIAIQQVRSPAWWSETVRQHMNTPGLLNIGKGKPTKTNEFLDMFGRGRGGWWVKSVLLSNVSCSDFSFKIIEKHTLKIPFCIIFMPKKPCSKVQILQHKFLDWKWPPPPPSELFRKFIRFGVGMLP